MSMLPERLKSLRKKHKLTQKQIAKLLDMTESGYGYYEQGRNQPSLETLDKLAKIYNVSVSYLTGEKSESKLTKEDEKDIAKRLEEFKEDLENQDGLLFSGEPMSEEAKESLLDAMEYAFRTTQKINKKYIPKKYRKDHDVD